MQDLGFFVGKEFYSHSSYDGGLVSIKWLGKFISGCRSAKASEFNKAVKATCYDCGT